MQIYGKDKMFIDICFPKGAENEFIEIAKKIHIDNIYFIKNNASAFAIPIDVRIPKTFNFGEEAKFNSICIMRNLERKRKFNSPMDINEVYIKEIKAKNCILCLSFNELVQNPLNLEKIRFVVKLAKKYRVNLMIASCADTPLNLTPKENLCGFSKLVGINKDISKNFYMFLTQGF